jgi:MFS family permease
MQQVELIAGERAWLTVEAHDARVGIDLESTEAQHAAARSGKIVWDATQARLVLGYGFFGFGYIVPATFLPAMAKQIIADPLVFGWSWPIFGLAAALSTFVLAVLPRSIDLRRAWIAAQVVMAAGVALPAITSGIAAILVSALAVGGTFMVITAAAMQEARRVAPREAAALIGVMTSAFAIGQILGPLTVSAAASAVGGFKTPLVIASVVLLCGAALIVRPHGAAALYPLVNRTKDSS